MTIKAKVDLPKEEPRKSPVSKTADGDTVVDWGEPKKPKGKGKKKDEKKTIPKKDTKKPKETTPGTVAGSPFVKPVPTKRRIKVLLWGETGTGKTLTSLQFPAPAVIDMEGGVEHYKAEFDFHLFEDQVVTEWAQVETAVDWLLTNEHPYRTLIIDPITVLWEGLQDKWLEIFMKKRRGSASHKGDFYEFQPGDWKLIKTDWKLFVAKLMKLDMNVILIARQKDKYAKGDFMKIVGETWDTEKNLPYYVDTVAQLIKEADGTRFMVATKDRTNNLEESKPYKVKGPLDFYPLFEKAWGKDELARKSEPIKVATDKQLQEFAKLCDHLELRESAIKRRLGDYGAKTPEQLSQKDIDKIIVKLRDAVAARGEE